MSQNRNKLIDLFIGNITNCVVHRILEKAIKDDIIRKRYDKEFLISFDIAKRYRDKINPKDKSFPLKDIEFIKEKIIRSVNSELKQRIDKGYGNIDLKLVASFVEDILVETKIK